MSVDEVLENFNPACLATCPLASEACAHLISDGQEVDSAWTALIEAQNEEKRTETRSTTRAGGYVAALQPALHIIGLYDGQERVDSINGEIDKLPVEEVPERVMELAAQLTVEVEMRMSGMFFDLVQTGVISADLAEKIIASSSDSTESFVSQIRQLTDSQQDNISKLIAAEIEVANEQGITDIYDSQGNVSLAKIYRQRTEAAEADLITKVAHQTDAAERVRLIFTCPGPRIEESNNQFCPTFNVAL